MDDGYLLAASLYIHLNPVKAGLAKTPQAYRWSSCRLYYRDDAPNSFVDPDFVLGLLTTSDIESKKKYRLLLNKGRKVEMDKVFEQKDAIGGFQSKFSAMFPSLFRHVDKKSRIAKTLGIELLGIDELENQIESMKKADFHHKPESRNAKKYLIEQLIARGYKRAEIAERLRVSRKTVYNIIKSSL